MGRRIGSDWRQGRFKLRGLWQLEKKFHGRQQNQWTIINSRGMANRPLEIAGFSILPIILPSCAAFPQSVRSYLFVKKHEPKEADENAERSLFIANIPVTTNGQLVRHLFQTQLAAGVVENVTFLDPNGRDHPATPIQSRKQSRKRKRITADDLELQLDTQYLPSTWDSQFLPVGSHCVALFVDRQSAELSFKSVKKASKAGKEIVWGEGLEDTLPLQGSSRYSYHNAHQFASRPEMVNLVENFMTSYNHMMELRSREQVRKRQIPDDEGFITVSKGFKGAARKDHAEEMASKQKEKNKPLENFYRFQMREKRKEQQAEMIKRFEEDKRRVEELKRRRGKIRVSYTLSMGVS